MEGWKTLSAEDIYGPGKILPHGKPFRLLDRVTINPDGTASGEMVVQEEHFRGIFGGLTGVSSALLIEMTSHVMAVAVSLESNLPEGTLPFLGGVNKASFSLERPRVGEIIHSEIRIVRQGDHYVVGRGQIFVGDRLVGEIGRITGAWGRLSELSFLRP